MIALLLGMAHGASFRAPLDLPALLETARTVAYGVVTEARCAPDGESTRYTVAVYGTLAGELSDEVTVRLPGGTCHGTTLFVPGVPAWNTGDEVVVFVPRDEVIVLRGAFVVHDDLSLHRNPTWYTADFPGTLDDLLVDLQDLGRARW